MIIIIIILVGVCHGHSLLLLLLLLLQLMDLVVGLPDVEPRVLGRSQLFFL